jgi:hypothetical protein
MRGGGRARAGQYRPPWGGQGRSEIRWTQRVHRHRHGRQARYRTHPGQSGDHPGRPLAAVRGIIPYRAVYIPPQRPSTAIPYRAVKKFRTPSVPPPAPACLTFPDRSAMGATGSRWALPGVLHPSETAGGGCPLNQPAETGKRVSVRPLACSGRVPVRDGVGMAAAARSPSPDSGRSPVWGLPHADNVAGRPRVQTPRRP